MEKLALIPAKPTVLLASSSNPNSIIPKKQCVGLPKIPNGSICSTKPRSKTILFAFTTRNSRRYSSHNRLNDNNNNNNNINNSNDDVELFECTSTTEQKISSVGVDSQSYVAHPNSQFGSPLFWIGVGVGFSALFSFGASWLKKYAMQQAFKTMMGQMGSQNNQFSNAAFFSGSPFGSLPSSTSGPSKIPSFPYQLPAKPGPNASGGTAGYAYSSPSPPGQSILNDTPSSAAKSQAMPPSPAASVTKDVSSIKPEVGKPVATDESETKTKAKQSEPLQPSPENYDETFSWNSSSASKFAEVVQNGSVSKEGTSSEWSQETRKRDSLFSVANLEKMMEDPNVQKMIYPHLPKEMRNPATFKWMLQNPIYRQQLQEMLDNMGEGALDNGVMERLNGFDLNSPEVKQQFDQIGLTPEEAMSRIISEPEIAKAFQNPRIQHAIMDCSQNPMNMIKYRDDKEVMAIFNKLQELFPGSSGF